LYALYAIGLQISQLGGLDALLELKVADLLFVDEEGVGVHEVRPGSERVLIEEIGEFDAAFGEYRHFETGMRARRQKVSAMDCTSRTRADRWVGIVPGTRRGGVRIRGVLGGEQNSAAVRPLLTALARLAARRAADMGVASRSSMESKTGAGFHDEGGWRYEGNSAAPL